jgi:hypothetical protein
MIFNRLLIEVTAIANWLGLFNRKRPFDMPPEDQAPASAHYAEEPGDGRIVLYDEGLSLGMAHSHQFSQATRPSS